VAQQTVPHVVVVTEAIGPTPPHFQLGSLILARDMSVAVAVAVEGPFLARADRVGLQQDLQ
jgi:hypothetical protein